MRFKSFKIGRSKETPDRDTAEAEEVSTVPIANLHEHLKNRAKGLEETGQQLGGLADTPEAPEEARSAPPQPHGPLDELTIEPGEEIPDPDEETDVGALLGEANEEVKLVEVGAEGAAPAKAEKEPAKEKEGDSLNNLFSQDEEDVNPLAKLIDGLPDVTTRELLDDLQEIKEIIHEWQQH